MGGVMYRCVATSVQAFIQQLAVSYVANGYWFYVEGEIPVQKSADQVDKKIIGRYGIDISKWTRARRKAEGVAGVQYLRFGRWFVILATPGRHVFFEMEPKFLDIRRTPLRFGGYAVTCRLVRGRWRTAVRIERFVYRALMRKFSEIALQDSDVLIGQFQNLPFEPYAGVRRQCLHLLWRVNALRRVASLEELPFSVVRFLRKPLCVFETKAMFLEEVPLQDRRRSGNLGTAAERK